MEECKYCKEVDYEDNRDALLQKKEAIISSGSHGVYLNGCVLLMVEYKIGYYSIMQSEIVTHCPACGKKVPHSG